MKLSTGHYIQVRQVGTRHHTSGPAPDPSIATTLHRVEFFESENAFKAGAFPLTQQDVVID